MASGNFQPCLDIVLQEEGGFVNDPRDPGGATNYGVTLSALQHWVGQSRVVLVQDVRDLTPTTVAPIYQAGFWQPVRGDLLPLGVDLATFDFGVNSGPGTAIRALQQAVGASVDGLIGPNTLIAVGKVPPATLIGEISAARETLLRGLSNFSTFGGGWMARVEKIRAKALAMAGH